MVQDGDFLSAVLATLLIANEIVQFQTIDPRHIRADDFQFREKALDPNPTNACHAVPAGFSQPLAILAVVAGHVEPALKVQLQALKRNSVFSAFCVAPPNPALKIHPQNREVRHSRFFNLGTEAMSPPFNQTLHNSKSRSSSL